MVLHILSHRNSSKGWKNDLDLANQSLASGIFNLNLDDRGPFSCKGDESPGLTKTLFPTVNKEPLFCIKIEKKPISIGK